MMFTFKDDFKAFCADHQCAQKRLSQSDRARLDMKKSSTCYICYSSVSTYTSFKVLRSPCCEKHFYHRHCIDKLAYSAGVHFFRCPMCNDKEKFQAEMLEFGVHIPDRDATWELEPQAYDSLLERHSHCDQDTCLCPEGRSADRIDSEWELILCSSCGSQGTHAECASLVKTRFPKWHCVDCKLVLERLRDEKKQTRSVTRAENSRRSGNGDIEICEDSEVEIIVVD